MESSDEETQEATQRMKDEYESQVNELQGIVSRLTRQLT